MKSILNLLLCACSILIVGRPGPCPAAEAGAATATPDASATAAGPDYRATINALFDQAASCKIYGARQEYRRHWIEFTAASAGSLQQLRQIFLQEQPRYLGTELPESLDLSSPFGLYFVWKDKQGRQIGDLKMPDEEGMLVLNGTHLFATSAAGAQTQNKTLLMNAAAFACPELIVERKLPKPDYKAAVEALFAVAASCEIEGDFSYRANPAHEVKFFTSDAGKLRQLKSLFLSETPRFVVSMNPAHTLSPGIAKLEIEIGGAAITIVRPGARK
jgi:hypothetical protein